MRALALAAIAAALVLTGCGGASSSASADPCPSGKTELTGHFRGVYCEPPALAAVAFDCLEAGYEMEIVYARDTRDPTPRTLRHELLTAARESEAIVARTEAELRATGHPPAAALVNLRLARGRLDAVERELRGLAPQASAKGVFSAFAKAAAACETPR